MTTASSRLGLPARVFWAYYGLPLWLAAVGAVMVIIGVLVFATGHQAAGTLAAGAFLVVLGLVDIGVLVPAGRKRVRAGRSQAVVLESDGTHLRMHRNGDKDHQVVLDRVRRVQVEYRVLTNPGRCAYAHLYGDGDHQLATWDIWPLTGKRVGTWFRHQGLDVDVRVVGRHERVEHRG